MEYQFSHRMSGLKPSATREIFKVTQDPEVISFAAGNPSPESFPIEELKGIAADIFQNSGDKALQYGMTEGYGPLRDITRERIARKYGVGGEGDDLIITSGGQQTIELAAKVLLNEGDVVISEEPSFIGALNAFRSYGAQLVGCPMDEEGIDTDRLEQLLQTTQGVKLIYTIPTFQNPSGRTMSLSRRRRLLELAEEYDVLIIEDSPYFELRYSGEPVPAIKSMDTKGRVIYSGSYSKVLSPGIRLGFTCAPAAIVSKMVVAKQVSDVHTNLFFQMAAAEYLTRYDIDAHIAAISDIYRAKRDRMLQAIDRHFDQRVRVSRPDGGLFIWCQLPEGYDSMELCRRPTGRKVAAVPAATFSVDENAPNTGFRLNFSMPTDEQIDTGIAILGEIIGEMLQ